MHPLATCLLHRLRKDELLHAGDRVGVAVSGGIDSVALLRLMLELRGELGIVLSVVHFNHKLRGAESDADEQFVANLARQHDLEFQVDSEDVARVAEQERVGVEAAARDVRYGFFRFLIGEDSDPQGLKPNSPSGLDGTAEAVPLPHVPGSAGTQGLKPHSEETPVRGAEAPLFHVDSDSAAGSRAPSNQYRRLDKIATGHTLDDQAETVLMRLIRGAGTRGLRGIYPRIAVEDDEGEVCGEIVRPLLAIRRCELEQYLRDIGQGWREDSTNSDEALTRNRVRKLVVPLLEREFNPSVAQNLAELAEIARGEEDYWENEAAGWMGTVVHWTEPEWAKKALSGAGLVQIQAGHKGSEPSVPIMRSQETRTLGTARPDPSTGKERPSQDDRAFLLQERIENAPWLVMNASVSRLWFLAEPIAVQRRLVKAIGAEAGIPFEFKHVEEILRFAGDGSAAGKELSLPLGWKLRTESDELVFLTPDLRETATTANYEYDLAVPGQVRVEEVEMVIEARRVPAESQAGYNAAHLLDAGSLPGPLRVRNWRPGDRFWPAHTKSPKKIKELLQERHLAQAERRLWPVVVSGNEIVWVRGFPPPQKCAARPGREAILIVEKALSGQTK